MLITIKRGNAIMSKELSRDTQKNRQWQIIQTRSDPDISLKSLARIQRITQNDNLTLTQLFTHPQFMTLVTNFISG